MLRKIVFLSFFLLALLMVIFPIQAVSADGTLDFLIIGTDDAADNADVIVIAHYDISKNSIMVFQVPRDSYYRFGRGQNKLNQYFAYLRSDGYSKEDSLGRFGKIVEEQFGIRFDGVVCLSTIGFSNLVKGYNGVTVDMPSDYDFVDKNGKTLLSLKKGQNRLTPEEALLFVRYRSGYTTGDIARLDAQKIFMRGLFDEISHQGIEPFVKAVIRKDDIYINMPIMNLVKNYIRYKIDLKECSVGFLTMPGRAVKSENVWYYVLNKNAVNKVMEYSFSNEFTEFDKYILFTDVKKQEINEIYTDSERSFQYYFDEKFLFN